MGYLKAVERVAVELGQLAEKDPTNRGYILLAIDGPEGKNNLVVAAAGTREVLEALIEALLINPDLSEEVVGALLKVEGRSKEFSLEDILKELKK